ncbi:MAG: methyl-accepting chemotaxis protein [Lachnospiraceae bacterium]|nr:methyl-accepting chemotaxis protein [Lachnospiraceae bacterium]
MKIKIMTMTLFSAIVAVAICLLTVIPNYKTNIGNTVMSTMLSLVKAYSSQVERTISAGDPGYDQYADVLTEAKVEGMSTSYAYLVDSQGTMLYHPTEDKVGNVVENSVVKELVAELQAGGHPADAVVSYEYKDAMKYASYAVLSNNSILVITADEAEAMQAVVAIETRCFQLCIFLLILISAYTIIGSTFMIRPLIHLTKVVSDTADFDFSLNPMMDKLCARKDEMGVIAKAIYQMRLNLRAMVENMVEVEHVITESVDELKQISVEINSKCTDNSATTEELAAGMEETSASTETIHESIGVMQDGAEHIKQLSVEGEQMSNEIRKRADGLKETTNTAIERTNSKFQEIQTKTNAAMEQSKAVEKINELTGAIMEISSQTSLLALNATIEAARAGEAGRGFAVVATEIGKLANQTSETVSSIDSIVKEVNEAVASMTDSLEGIENFLETVVIKDYSQFSEVSVQYDEDAQSVNENMTTIEQAINQLNDTIAEITDAITAINDTVNESAQGVTDIAEKTTEVVTQTVNNNELVDHCLETVQQLQKIVEQFKLE